MSTCTLRIGFLLSVSTLATLLPGPVHANHRRALYGAKPVHHCRATAYGTVSQANVAILQPAAIPPGMIPILVNVGQELGTVALDRLIDRLRQQLDDEGGRPNPRTQNESTVVSNTDLESASSKLDLMEKKLGLGGGSAEKSKGLKGSIRFPQGTPSDMPSFR
jgi:hypothetical protein